MTYSTPRCAIAQTIYLKKKRVFRGNRYLYNVFVSRLYAISQNFTYVRNFYPRYISSYHSCCDAKKDGAVINKVAP